MNKSVITRSMAFAGVMIISLLVMNNSVMLWSLACRGASYITYPVLVIQHTCVQPIHEWFERRATLEHYWQEIKELKQNNEELVKALIELQALLDYQDDIQELVAFKKRYDCAHACAVHILVKNVSPEEHFFLVDAGSQQGVTQNMIAVYQNHLIGKVVEVYPYYSKVLLITDRSCKVSAYCSNTKASGIYAGTNDINNTSLLHVSHLADMQEHDMILSTGDGLIFPRGFALGRVATYQRNDFLYDITAEPLIDITALTHCYLLQKGQETIRYNDEQELVLLDLPPRVQEALEAFEDEIGAQDQFSTMPEDDQNEKYEAPDVDEYLRKETTDTMH